jgi:hypothetical protein
VAGAVILLVIIGVFIVSNASPSHMAHRGIPFRKGQLHEFRRQRGRYLWRALPFALALLPASFFGDRSMINGSDLW